MSAGGFVGLPEDLLKAEIRQPGIQEIHVEADRVMAATQRIFAGRLAQCEAALQGIVARHAQQMGRTVPEMLDDMTAPMIAEMHGAMAGFGLLSTDTAHWCRCSFCSGRKLILGGESNPDRRVEACSVRTCSIRNSGPLRSPSRAQRSPSSITSECEPRLRALAAYVWQRDDTEHEVWTLEIKHRASIRIELSRNLG